MAFGSVVALLALIEYVTISMLTGRARATYKVEAPASTGHPIFERWYLVQQNALEPLIVFLPALLLCANCASARWAGWLGLAFIVGRIIYARSYVADPASRGTGFIIGVAARTVRIRVLGGFGIGTGAAGRVLILGRYVKSVLYAAYPHAIERLRAAAAVR